VNLATALTRMTNAVRDLAPSLRVARAYAEAGAVCAEDVAINRAIGEHGFLLLRALAHDGAPLQVLTHCNAGRLAAVDLGTALAPVYRTHQAGVPVHVWVSETRPRGQGALTAWELGEAGIPCTVVADNAAGLLLQRGLVDICLVGTDRTTAAGDVGNKIGTYLKALAAREHGVPFYACVPGPSIDWTMHQGADIPIEERDPDEVRTVMGLAEDGQMRAVRIVPASAVAANPAFDVTPGHLVTGLITERGVCAATAAGLATLFPERFP
jgi:methylthioribose-1-phosphate isomerase